MKRIYCNPILRRVGLKAVMHGDVLRVTALNPYHYALKKREFDLSTRRGRQRWRRCFFALKRLATRGMMARTKLRPVVELDFL
jgi:hypothetical protein